MNHRSRIVLLLSLAALSCLSACSATPASDAHDGDELATGQTSSALTGTRVPMYELYSAASTDHYYTTSAASRDQAISYGFSFLGTPFYVESAQVAGTTAWRGFYANVPQTDHFYTFTPGEVDYVLAYGWSEFATGAYVYPTQVPGSIPLYRTYMYNPATGDNDHRFTTSLMTVASMQAQGWETDGVHGYVWGEPEAPPPPPPPTEQSDELSVRVVPSTGGTVEITNMRTGVKHTYPQLVACGSYSLLTPDELNGDPGREAVIVTECNQIYVIDDAKQRVTAWSSKITPGRPPLTCFSGFPPPARIELRAMIANPDVARPGKELVVISKWSWRSSGCGGFDKLGAGAYLEVIKFSAGSSASTTSTAQVAAGEWNLDFGGVPANTMWSPEFLFKGDLDGVPGVDVALNQGYDLQIWKGGAAGYTLFRKASFTSPSTTFMLAGDTNNVAGAEIVVTQLTTWDPSCLADAECVAKAPKTIIVWSPATNTSRTYYVNATKVKTSFKDRDGVGGNEICYRVRVGSTAGCLDDSTAPWCLADYIGYMIVDRTGQIFVNADCR